MAINRRQIVGSVLKPDGTGYNGGQIKFTLSAGFGTTPDDTTSEVYSVGGQVVVPIGQDGSVDFYLVPNDDITPAGTVWYADFLLPGNVSFREVWLVATGGASIYIGDVTRQDLADPGLRYLILTTVNDLPTASAAYRGWVAYVFAGTGEADQEYRCFKGTDDTYDWYLIGSGI